MCPRHPHGILQRMPGTQYRLLQTTDLLTCLGEVLWRMGKILRMHGRLRLTRVHLIGKSCVDSVADVFAHGPWLITQSRVGSRSPCYTRDAGKGICTDCSSAFRSRLSPDNRFCVGHFFPSRLGRGSVSLRRYHGGKYSILKYRSYLRTLLDCPLPAPVPFNRTEACAHLQPALDKTAVWASRILHAGPSHSKLSARPLSHATPDPWDSAQFEHLGYDSETLSNALTRATSSPVDSSGGGFFSRLRHKATKSVARTSESPRSSIDRASPSSSEHGSPVPGPSRFSWFSRKLPGTGATSPRVSSDSVRRDSGLDTTSHPVKDDPETSAVGNKPTGADDVFGGLQEAFWPPVNASGPSQSSVPVASGGLWDDLDPLKSTASSNRDNPQLPSSSSLFDRTSTQHHHSHVSFSSHFSPPSLRPSRAPATTTTEGFPFGRPGTPPNHGSRGLPLSPDSQPLAMLYGQDNPPRSSSPSIGTRLRPNSLPAPASSGRSQQPSESVGFVLPPPPSSSQPLLGTVPPRPRSTAAPERHTSQPPGTVSGSGSLSASDLAFFEGS
jgi:hypothetical protein